MPLLSRHFASFHTACRHFAARRHGHYAAHFLAAIIIFIYDAALSFFSYSAFAEPAAAATSDFVRRATPRQPAATPAGHDFFSHAGRAAFRRRH